MLAFALGVGGGYWAAGHQRRYDSNHWQRRISIEKIRKTEDLNYLLKLVNKGIDTNEKLYLFYHKVANLTIFHLGGSTNTFSPGNTISKRLGRIYEERFGINQVLEGLELIGDIKPIGELYPKIHAQFYANQETFQNLGAKKDILGFKRPNLDETGLSEIVRCTIEDIANHFSNTPDQEEIRSIENIVSRYRVGSGGIVGGLVGLVLCYCGVYYVKTRRENSPTE